MASDPVSFVMGPVSKELQIPAMVHSLHYHAMAIRHNGIVACDIDCIWE